MSQISVGTSLEVLEDPSGKLTFDDIRTPEVAARFEPAPETPTYGFSESAYWFHFAVESSSDLRHSWLLEIGYPLLDDIQLFIETAAGDFTRRRAGDRYPFAQRELRHTNFLFTLPLVPGTVQQIYVRVQTEGSVAVPMILWRSDAFAQADHQRQIGLGIYYGAMTVMLVFNLFVFFSVREKAYLYYVCYLASFISFQLALDGLGYEYLWPTLPAWHAVSICFFIAGVVAMVAMFAKSFLHLPHQLPGFNRALNVMIALAVVLAVASFTAPYAFSIRLAAGLGLITAVIALLAGIKALRVGNRAARFYVAAWITFLVGTVALGLAKFGILDYSFITENGLQIGSLLEVMLLSFALADRINIMKREAHETLEREVERQTHELREQAEQLKELDQQKTRFFQNVSHELRTPLTLILNPLEELRADVAGDGDKRVAMAAKNARRLLRLVNQLLDFQKLTAGKRVFELRPIDLATFARSCADYVVPACEKRGIRFELDFPERSGDGDGAPAPAVWVQAEADAVEKIAFNYLSNALKYTPDGGRIELSLEVRETGGDPVARLSVTDSGPGIPPEQQKRLFQVFSQLDDEVARNMDSTGLGLAHVKELAEALGGRAGVQSEVGRGSTFFVELPTIAPPAERPADDSRARPTLADWKLAEADEAERAVSGAAAEQSTAAGELVLVVDDLADMREVLTRVLTRHGHRVIGASNGARGLEAAREHRPSLVVSDWMMPVMSGPELIAELKGDRELASTPVILLTAKSDEESKLIGTQIGADAFLGKPFNDQELASVVANLLKLKAREREVEILNRELEKRVLEQADELRRFANVSRFLPPLLARQLLDGNISLAPGRRAITTLRLDVVSFDDLAAQLDAEALAALVGQFHTLTSEIVFSFGGTVASLHGCRLEALFGALGEVDPTHGARDALAATESILDALAAAAPAWRDIAGRPALAIRGGTDTGEALVGAFGGSEWSLFAAVGDPVVRADWLASYAAPGEMLIAEETVVAAGIEAQWGEPTTVSLREHSATAYRLPVPAAIESPIEDVTFSETLSDTGQSLSSHRADRGPVLESIAAIPPGTKIGGRFRVESRMGRGGMGAVYEVEDELLGTKVALKLFRRTQGEDDRRIRREVQLARLVTHPNVCRVFDIHFFAGRPAVSMELIRGASVRSHLRNGPIPLEQFLRWMIPICQGLRAAHACGVVHRDIKPENILIEESGRPVLVDFGIARPDSGEIEKRFEGTLDYVAPEQITSHVANAGTDIYSLAVVLFEMATGALPFRGPTPLARALARADDDPIDPATIAADLNPRLAAVILRCLDRQPAHRPQRIGDIVDSLQRIALQAGIPWLETAPARGRTLRGGEHD